MTTASLAAHVYQFVPLKQFQRVTSITSILTLASTAVAVLKFVPMMQSIRENKEAEKWDKKTAFNKGGFFEG